MHSVHCVWSKSIEELKHSVVMFHSTAELDVTLLVHSEKLEMNNSFQWHYLVVTLQSTRDLWYLEILKKKQQQSGHLVDCNIIYSADLSWASRWTTVAYTPKPCWFISRCKHTCSLWNALSSVFDCPDGFLKKILWCKMETHCAPRAWMLYRYTHTYATCFKGKKTKLLLVYLNTFMNGVNSVHSVMNVNHAPFYTQRLKHLRFKEYNEQSTQNMHKNVHIPTAHSYDRTNLDR